MGCTLLAAPAAIPSSGTELFNPATLEEDELSSALRTNERQTPEVRGHSYTNKRHYSCFGCVFSEEPPVGA